VIYNGIDPAPFMSPPAKDLKKQLGLSQNANVIGFVGQLDERKGIDVLLPAFAKVARDRENLHLVMVGEGPERAGIEQFAQTHNLQNRIHLLGFQKEIEDIMKSIDALVLPSYWEGFGIVLIEAMAAARPAVTTNVSSMPEIVLDHQTGRVVPVGNAEALAQAMQQIVENPDLAHQWGLAGQKRVLEHFTLDKMIDQLELYFKQQVQKKSGQKK